MKLPTTVPGPPEAATGAGAGTPSRLPPGHPPGALRRPNREGPRPGPPALAALLVALAVPPVPASGQEKARPASTRVASSPAAASTERTAGPRPGRAARRSEGPAPRPATAGARDPDGLPFRTPIASPLEPANRLALARVVRDTAERGVALPDLAARIPFRLAGPPAGRDGWTLAGTVVAGVFSRFDLRSTDNEFLEVHYRTALRLRAGRGPLAARLSLHHVSSHLGDEYQERTGRAPVSTSREGLELLVQGAPVPGLTVYAGPGLLIRSSRGLERPSLRAGVEWRDRDAGGGWYAAAEAFAWAELGWDPLLSLEAGRRLGRRFRLGVAAGTGPSRAEQFLREGERLLGIVFTVLP